MSSAIEVPQRHRCELAMTSIDVTRGGVLKQIAGEGGLTNTALLVREVEAVRRAVTAVADVDAATVRALELT